MCVTMGVLKLDHYESNGDTISCSDTGDII